MPGTAIYKSAVYMGRLPFALLFAASAALAAPSKGPAPLGDLPAGRYRIAVSGLLCKVCERAVTEELKGLQEVESAAVDFDKGEIVLSIKKGQILAASALRKALYRASKRINLGNRIEVVGVLVSPSF